jgi:hypothetical protein
MGGGDIAPLYFIAAVDECELLTSRPSRLTPEKEPPALIVQAAGWALEPVWTL